MSATLCPQNLTGHARPEKSIWCPEKSTMCPEMSAPGTRRQFLGHQMAFSWQRTDFSGHQVDFSGHDLAGFQGTRLQTSGPRGLNIMSTFMPVAVQWEGLG